MAFLLSPVRLRHIIKVAVQLRFRCPAAMQKRPQKQIEATRNVSERLGKAVAELRSLDRLLRSGEEIEARILTDFRDSLNRVRNAAWSAQQYLAQKDIGEDPANLRSILASERVRATYQLCQAVQHDLSTRAVKFQPGQLLQLQSIVNELAKSLNKTLEEADKKSADTSS
jgi:hypothetical protein